MFKQIKKQINNNTITVSISCGTRFEGQRQNSGKARNISLNTNVVCTVVLC